MELSDLRKEIDIIDIKLMNLLNERAQVSITIGEAKKESMENSSTNESQAYAPARMKETFDKVKRLNYGPLSGDSVCAIYREILSASISMQKDVSIAFFGLAGSFTHEAATERFGNSVLYIPCATIPSVFDAVEQGRATYGVVPFENSTHGSVLATLDRFESSKVQIRAEVYLTVHHCLLSNSKLSSLKRVYSHPQALGQCAKWLSANLPNVELVETTSTSYAAQLAAKEPNAAAIAGIACAELYGVNVLKRNIEDGKDNTTRFFVLGGSSDQPTGDDKTYIMFTVDHREPGALCDALRVFKDHNINLTKIDTRPSHQRMWHYYFFLECDGHCKDGSVAEVLDELEDFCLDIKVLGSYPDQRPKA